MSNTSKGFQTVTPYMVINDAARLISFLKDVFGAEEREIIPAENKKIMHAEIKIGDSMIMMTDSMEGYPANNTNLYVYVNDADEVYNKAIQSGAESIREPKDEYYGDRTAGVKDHSGNQWWIAQHKETIPTEEIKKRMEEWKEKNKK